MLIFLLKNEIAKRNPPPVYYLRKTGNLNAFTIPAVGIFINQKQRGNKLLLEHERIHWQQYQRYGLARFAIGYLKENITRGYDANRYEIEARRHESKAVRRNYTAAVRNGTAKTVYNPNFRK